MRNLKEHGIVPSSDVLFLAEADEESGQRWGSRWLLEHRPEWFDGVAVVLNEGGTNEMILRDVRFWGIETVQAGYGLIQFEAPAAQAIEDLARRWPKIHSRCRRASSRRRPRFRHAGQSPGASADRSAAPSRPRAEESRRAGDPARPLRLFSGGADQVDRALRLSLGGEEQLSRATWSSPLLRGFRRTPFSRRSSRTPPGPGSASSSDTRPAPRPPVPTSPPRDSSFPFSA